MAAAAAEQGEAPGSSPPLQPASLPLVLAATRAIAPLAATELAMPVAEVGLGREGREMGAKGTQGLDVGHRQAPPLRALG